MTRALSAARLYFADKWMLVWIPLIVLGAMVGLTVIIRLIMLAADGDPDAVYFNGAFQAVFWVLFGVAMAASTQMFPFAFAMSLTRRDFIAGTLLVALVISGGYGLLYGFLAWLEQASDGYWIGARSFDLMGFAGSSLGTAFVLYTGIIGLFFTLGLASSMLWKRFSGKGLVVTGLILLTVGSALVAWATIANAWHSVGQWAVDQTALTVGGYTLAASLVLAAASALLIRHAEP